MALGGRDVPRLVVPELNDPLYGPFEGAHDRGVPRLGARRAVVRRRPGDGGESRHAIVERYVRGFRIVLDRPEEAILVVAHSLPISYLLGALEGLEPGAAGAARPVRDPVRPHGRGARALRSACSRTWLARSDLVDVRQLSAGTLSAWGSSSGSTSTSAGTS